MINWLRHIDHAVFHFVNTTASAEWLDPIMILLSTRWIWIPVYIFLLWLLVKKYRSRVWLVILMLSAVVAGSDSISSRVIKPGVLRLRPNKAMDLQVRLPNPKDGNSRYGFVSSHAANSFAVFVFCGLFLWRGWRRFLPYLIIPVMVCYSRVYLGVHYPADVLGGALLGTALAWLACILFMRLPQKWQFTGESE